MFGYVLPDKPNMFMKDYALYRSFYCGMCKQIKRCHKSNLLRLSVNYDVTFINVFLHGVTGCPMAFREERCILNPFKKKCVLIEDEVSVACVYLNTLLADFKARDDLHDRPSPLKRLLRSLFKGKVKKAGKELPEVAQALDKAYLEQAEVEKEENCSFDQAATPFARCMQEIFRLLTKDKYTEDIGDVGFYLAKYVYLLDAVDDFEKDVKKGEFNPFKEWKDCRTKAELMEKHEKELREILDGLLYLVKDAYARIAVFGTEAIITNTLWFGLAARANAVFDKENKKCLKTHTKF